MKAERMRAVKRARTEESTPESTVPIATLSHSSVETSPLPGPSRALIVMSTPSVEIESTNWTDEGESSFDESAKFDNDVAQDIFDDWVVSLLSADRKMLSVALMHSFQKRQGMTVMDAEQESGSICGFNEKTVRCYRGQFFDGKGNFKETKQGKYDRQRLLYDENLCLDAAMWARENAYKKGEANMTAGKYCQWVNNELLPSHVLPANVPRSISVCTANCWLHQLGFSPQSHKKGSYVDGHEREDVVKSREEF